MLSGHEWCLNRCESLIVLDEIVIFIFLGRPILVLLNVFYNLSHPYGLMHAIAIVAERRAALGWESVSSKKEILPKNCMKKFRKHRFQFSRIYLQNST